MEAIIEGGRLIPPFIFLGVPTGGYNVYDINGTQMYGEMFIWEHLNLFFHWDYNNDKVIAIYVKLALVETAIWTMVSLT